MLCYWNYTKCVVLEDLTYLSITKHVCIPGIDHWIMEENSYFVNHSQNLKYVLYNEFEWYTVCKILLNISVIIGRYGVDMGVHVILQNMIYVTDFLDWLYNLCIAVFGEK